MPLKHWFTILMKSAPPVKKKNQPWIVDEGKCLKLCEVIRLRHFCEKIRDKALETQKFSPIRNWFMIEIGLNAGLRVSEIASLKHRHVYIDSGRSSISFIGKGDKPRAVWINSEFKKIFHEYIRYKKEFGYSVDDDSYALNNIKGEKVSRRALQKFFKQIIIKAGLPERYYIHCLRHTYATFLLQASNNDYKFVAKQLGHSSIRTTEIYAGIIESRSRRALNKLYK